jgi:hypothetical protein
MFIRELKRLSMAPPPPQGWLVMGDLNLISSTWDKNNGRINRAMMNRFQKAIDHLQVRELNLVGKKFTWSNNQAAPTMTRIDKVFCTPDWESLYDKSALSKPSSPLSQIIVLSFCLLSPLISPDPNSGLNPFG